MVVPSAGLMLVSDHAPVIAAGAMSAHTASLPSVVMYGYASPCARTISIAVQGSRSAIAPLKAYRLEESDIVSSHQDSKASKESSSILAVAIPAQPDDVAMSYAITAGFELTAAVPPPIGTHFLPPSFDVNTSEFGICAVLQSMTMTACASVFQSVVSAAVHDAMPVSTAESAVDPSPVWTPSLPMPVADVITSPQMYVVEVEIEC